MLVNPTNSRHLSNLSSSIVRSKGSRAVVVHAAPTPSPAYSGLNKENGIWGKNGGGEGEWPDGRRTEVSSHVAASE
eukprot:scaffold9864_cov124-Isochrysis_galbana.AAC.2